MYFVIETFVNASLTIARQACMGVRCRSLKGLGTVGSGLGGTNVHFKEFIPEIKSKLKKNKYFDKEWYPFVLPSLPNLDINFTIFFSR